MVKNRFIVIFAFKVDYSGSKSVWILDFATTHHMKFDSQHFLNNIFPFDILYIIIAENSHTQVDVVVEISIFNYF